MKHPHLACRLGTCARAPDYALSPNLYTMCTPTRMHIRTRTLTHAHKLMDAFTLVRLFNFSPTFLASSVSTPVPLSPLVKRFRLWNLASLHLHYSRHPHHTRWHIFIYFHHYKRIDAYMNESFQSIRDWCATICVYITTTHTELHVELSVCHMCQYASQQCQVNLNSRDHTRTPTV